MTTIDKKGAFHDSQGRYADKPGSGLGGFQLEQPESTAKTILPPIYEGKDLVEINDTYCPWFQENRLSGPYPSDVTYASHLQANKEPDEDYYGMPELEDGDKGVYIYRLDETLRAEYSDGRDSNEFTEAQAQLLEEKLEGTDFELVEIGRSSHDGLLYGIKVQDGKIPEELADIVRDVIGDVDNWPTGETYDKAEEVKEKWAKDAFADWALDDAKRSLDDDDLELLEGDSTDSLYSEYQNYLMEIGQESPYSEGYESMVLPKMDEWLTDYVAQKKGEIETEAIDEDIDPDAWMYYEGSSDTNALEVENDVAKFVVQHGGTYDYVNGNLVVEGWPYGPDALNDALENEFSEKAKITWLDGTHSGKFLIQPKDV